MPVNTVVAKPTIAVNGTNVADFRPDYANDTIRYTSQDVLEVKGRVNLTFGIPSGATVRYTINGDNPTLGSPAYTAGSTVTLRENTQGNQYTVVKAKAYYQGLVSNVAKAVFKIWGTTTSG